MHWHIYYAFPGCLPEGDPSTYESVEAAAEDLHDHWLDKLSEGLYEDAVIAGEAGEYEEAWKTIMRSEEVGNLARNFSPTRRNVPTYDGRPEAFRKMLLALIHENFPLDGSRGTYLYVTECVETDCEVEADDE